jgi:hypothetical protein
MIGVEQTGLWRAAFVVEGHDHYNEQRQRLAASYRLFWECATILAQQIAKDLPNLTLHDERHFTALWQRADLIAGKGFFLNPLEAYVFGGAVLLHEAGNTVSAYPERLSGIEKTKEWKDSLVLVLRREGLDPPPADLLANPPAEIRQKSIFETLRILHAEHAKTLPEMAVINAATGQILYLIDDSELRTHLGEAIGLIAASHHWDIHDVEVKLRRRMGPPAGFPPEWTIQPIKLACLLRCADAVQLDQARAPDFSYALLRLSGLSESHWRGQNRLATPTTDPTAPEALLFTSTKSFRPEDADAWWIAHDAIKLADRELQTSDRLLQDLGMAPFAVTRVQDADSPERLSKHVQVQGWRPVSAEFKTAPVEQLIAILGGEQLYGHDLAVPVRELIQNASDAIRARRVQEEGYSGRTVVRLLPDKDGGRESLWLHVEDDGIGMSERCLTGPLLEFGTSYWSSNLARIEFPGLTGGALRQTGRYGVGFFSVLMASDRIIVASRNYNQGATATRSLNFSRGLKTRPLLVEGADPPLPMTTSTRVRVSLTPDRLRNLLLMRSGLEQEASQISLAQLIGHICLSVDCDVQVEDVGHEIVTVHRRDWVSGDRLEWLRRITLADCRKDENLDACLRRIAPNLRPLTSTNSFCGLAAIAFLPHTTGVGAIGGLITGAASRIPMHFSADFAGVMELAPEGPRRFGANPLADPSDIATWASTQAELLRDAGLNDFELFYACQSVSHFGGDPTPIARISLNRHLKQLNEIFDLLYAGSEVIVPVSCETSREKLYVSRMTIRTSPHSSLGLGVQDIDFGGRHVLEWVAVPATTSPSRSYNYRDIPSNKDAASNSFLDCLERYCRRQGRELTFESDADILFGNYIGTPSEREGIQSGMEIRGPGLRLKLASV